jgi:hypothetical protein
MTRLGSITVGDAEHGGGKRADNEAKLHSRSTAQPGGRAGSAPSAIHAGQDRGGNEPQRHGPEDGQ